MDFPTEIELFKQEIADEEAMKEKQGLQQKWNGPFYGLAKYQHGRTADLEGIVWLGVHPLLDRHSQNNGPDLYCCHSWGK